jgi:hypothetical protein
MAANNSGANYFIRQVRTIGEHSINTSEASEVDHNHIHRLSHAPYKGLKQMKSTSKILSAKAQQLQTDLLEVRASFDSTTYTAGNAIIPPTIWINHSDDLTNKFESYYQFNSKSKPQRIDTSSLSSAFLASEIGVQSYVPKLRIKLNKPRSAFSGIKLRFKSPTALSTTTENNGITKIVTEKRLRIKFNLADKDRLPREKENRIRCKIGLPEHLEELNKEHFMKLKFKAPSTDQPTSKINVNFPPVCWQRPKLILKLRPEEQYPLQMEMQPIDLIETRNVDSEIKNDDSSMDLITALPSNNKFYKSTRYYAVAVPKKETVPEKEQEELDLVPERFTEKIYHERYMGITHHDNQYRMLSSKYHLALKNEAIKPTVVHSQVKEIHQRVATEPLKQRSTYDELMNHKGVTATQHAQKIVDLKSKVARLIRLTESYIRRVGNGSGIEKEHVLSAIPLHMHMQIPKEKCH